MYYMYTVCKCKASWYNGGLSPSIQHHGAVLLLHYGGQRSLYMYVCMYVPRCTCGS